MLIATIAVAALSLPSRGATGTAAAQVAVQAQLVVIPEGNGTLIIDSVPADPAQRTICAPRVPLFEPVPEECARQFPSGARVKITAVSPNMQGAGLVRWSDYRCGTFSSCTLTLRGGVRHLSAFFTPAFLTVERGSFGEVSVEGSNCVFDNNDQCSLAFALGSSVTLTRDPIAATEPDDEWTGSCTGAGATCTLTMKRNEFVRAGTERNVDVPVRVGQTITLEYKGPKGGSITLTPRSGNGKAATCKQTCTRSGYQRGDLVTIAVRSSKKTKFSSWGDGYGGDATSRGMTIGERNPVRAVFKAKKK